MNLTTFNQIVVAPFCKGDEIIKKSKQIEDYPLFVMDSGADLSAEVISNLRAESLTDLMPFDGIRLFDRMDDGKRINEWLIVAERVKEEIMAFAVCHSVMDKATGNKKVAPARNGISFIIHNQLDAKRAFFSNGEFINSADYLDPQAYNAYDNAARHVLFSFFINLMNPHLHKATVRPDKQGKSVEWLRQRTHFVFIHKSHEANQAGFSGKADIGTDHIKRMAHSRRAHTRTLRHPKWGAKVGLKIRVKSCWVGPKEWRGNSGQIYRIVD